MYVVGSVLRERRPSRVDSVVNLDGRFVVPPFGDAHQHRFDPSRASAFVARQVHDGIFYIKEQSGAPMARRIAERALSAPGGLDLIAIRLVHERRAASPLVGCDAAGHISVAANRAIGRRLRGERAS